MAKKCSRLNGILLEKWLFDTHEESFLKAIKNKVAYSTEAPLIEQEMIKRFNTLSEAEKINVQRKVDLLLKKTSALASHSNLVILASSKKQEQILRPHFLKILFGSSSPRLSKEDMTLMLEANPGSLDLLLKGRRKFLGLISYGYHYAKQLDARFCLSIITRLPEVYKKLRAALYPSLSEHAKSVFSMQEQKKLKPGLSMPQERGDDLMSVSKSASDAFDALPLDHCTDEPLPVPDFGKLSSTQGNRQTRRSQSGTFVQTDEVDLFKTLQSPGVPSTVDPWEDRALEDPLSPSGTPKADPEEEYCFEKLQSPGVTPKANPEEEYQFEQLESPGVTPTTPKEAYQFEKLQSPGVTPTAPREEYQFEKLQSPGVTPAAPGEAYQFEKLESPGRTIPQPKAPRGRRGLATPIGFCLDGQKRPPLRDAAELSPSRNGLGVY